MRAHEFIKEATDEQINDLRKLYDDGVSLSDIAGMFDTTTTTIKRWLNQSYPNRSKRQNPIDYSSINLEMIRQMLDQGMKSNEIALKINLPVDTVRNVIKNKFPDRVKKFVPKKLTADQIKDLRDAYDAGFTVAEIGTLIGKTPSQTGNLILQYYPDRKPRRVHAAKAATDDDKQKIIQMWNDGSTIKVIANAVGVDHTTVSRWLNDEFGEDAIAREQQRRRETGGSIRIGHKVTPEMREKMRELYVTGMTLSDIADRLGNVVDPRNVLANMVKEPDYKELRAKRDERTQSKVNTGSPATTKIYRPGTIGNRQHKGPGSKHTSGMFPSSKWGMYKP